MSAHRRAGARGLAALLLVVASACDGPPARLVAGIADTVVVNGQRPTQIPVSVFDAAGHRLNAAPDVRFRWTSGVAVPVSAAGAVTCTQHGDAVVRASLGRAGTDVVVRCRPVHGLRSLRLVELVLGDPAQRLYLEAVGADGSPIELLAGTATIADSTIATLDGLMVRARSPGATMVTVFVGDHSTRAGVGVYERVPTLHGLRPEQRFVAVPLRLEPGEERRWRIAAGDYLVSILPDRSSREAPRLAIIGANCTRPSAMPFHHCLAGSDAAVVVYHPRQAGSAAMVTGHLAVRRRGDLQPGDAAALRE